MTRPQFFAYNLSDELTVDSLQTRFANHRRLSLFAQKGCVCVSCGRVGTRVIRGLDKGGGKHWDLYTDDLVPLTVDHIIPRSLGGPDEMSNYQPMCFPCNNKKGNGLPRNHNNRTPKKKYDKTQYKMVSLKTCSEVVGMDLWKIVGTNAPKHLGVADGVAINPHTLKPSLTISRGHKISYFDVGKSLYVKAA